MVRAEVFLLAVKLATLSTNAMMPFIARIQITCIGRGHLVAYATTASISPVAWAQKTHWANAIGDIRKSKSMGCSFSLPTWTRFVTIVLTEAKNVPSRVKMKPNGVKLYSPRVAYDGWENGAERRMCKSILKNKSYVSATRSAESKLESPPATTYQHNTKDNWY